MLSEAILDDSQVEDNVNDGNIDFDHFAESFVLNDYDEDYHDMHGDKRSNTRIEYDKEVAEADHYKSMQSAIF